MVLKRLKNTPLPYRPALNDEATVQLHPVPSGEGVIVKVQPPLKPFIPLEHVPCDIVLAIDVSGSMTADAPVPTKPGGEVETTGLSVLDLTKHAARTIMETLNEGDRLGIVTFSTASCVLQKLLPMTDENKKETDKRIESMQPKDATNLWHGIRDGLKLFKSDNKAQDEGPKRVPALMVLTDGCPNHMCPAQGYVPKLRAMGKLPATIHTFGFGYSLRSGLLKSIAEIGGGNYSFIPDAGMVGTVFIHTVANLQSTFAQNTVLSLTYPSELGLQKTTGQTVDQRAPVELETDPSLTELTINLNNIQYGQSRDIYLTYTQPSSPPNKTPLISATLTYQRLLQPRSTTSTTTLSPPLPPPETAYHISRSLLISFLLSLTPPSAPDQERIMTTPLPEDLQIPTKLSALISTLPANNPSFLSSSPACAALLADLTGQISLALNSDKYYSRWGVHYLPSLAGAHASQVCNSFKDQGVGVYGEESALFRECRERLDRAFDELPAPTPSNAYGGWDGRTRRSLGGGGGGGVKAWVREKYRYRTRTRGGSGSSWDVDTPGEEGGEDGGKGRPRYWAAGFSMSSYNDEDNPCFAGCVWVRLAPGEGETGKGKRLLTPDEDVDGDEGVDPLEGYYGKDMDGGDEGSGKMIRIAKLRAGMMVQTPKGPRRVVAVLKTAVRREDMCLVGRGLLVTPWHPVSLPNTEKWAFPNDISRRKVRYTGSIYSVLLERDEDPEAHAVMVGGVWGVTLGHGLVRDEGGSGSTETALCDVRAHPFFGSYDLVVRSLARLHRNRSGLVLGGGVQRSRETGLVDGFRRASLDKAGNVSGGGVVVGVRRNAVCVA